MADPNKQNERRRSSYDELRFHTNDQSTSHYQWYTPPQSIYARELHRNPYLQPHLYPSDLTYDDDSQDIIPPTQQLVPRVVPRMPPSKPTTNAPHTSTLFFPTSQPSTSTSVTQAENDSIEEKKAKSSSERGPRWDDAQTRLLLNVWEENYKNIDKKRNKSAWEEIARELNCELTANGIFNVMRTASQCKSKIKNLTDEYKRVCDANAKSGNSRQDFKYYEEVNNVLGCRDSSKPGHIVEVGSSAVDESDEVTTEIASDNDDATSAVNKSPKSTGKGKKTRGQKRKRDDDDSTTEMIRYLEESEKRERDFFLRLTEMEERQQERNIKLIAEIAKMLKLLNGNKL